MLSAYLAALFHAEATLSMASFRRYQIFAVLILAASQDAGHTPATAGCRHVHFAFGHFQHWLSSIFAAIYRHWLISAGFSRRSWLRPIVFDISRPAWGCQTLLADAPQPLAEGWHTLGFHIGHLLTDKASHTFQPAIEAITAFIDSHFDRHRHYFH